MTGVSCADPCVRGACFLTRAPPEQSGQLRACTRDGCAPSRAPAEAWLRFRGPDAGRLPLQGRRGEGALERCGGPSKLRSAFLPLRHLPAAGPPGAILSPRLRRLPAQPGKSEGPPGRLTCPRPSPLPALANALARLPPAGSPCGATCVPCASRATTPTPTPTPLAGEHSPQAVSVLPSDKTHRMQGSEMPSHFLLFSALRYRERPHRGAASPRRPPPCAASRPGRGEAAARLCSSSARRFR